jgi:hypothetical protein
MCLALQYESLSIIAFNNFIHNQTCQLFPTNFSSLASFYIISSVNSTFFVLSATFIYQLKSICCAEISWVMNKIQLSNTFRNATITKPVGLALDNDLSKLIVTFWNTRSMQQRELTHNMTDGRSLFVKTNSQPISYHDGLYYVGINPPMLYLHLIIFMFITQI